MKRALKARRFKPQEIVGARFRYYLTDESDFDNHPLHIMVVPCPKKGKFTYHNRKPAKG